MYYRDPQKLVIKDNLHWEATMELRWYAPWKAERIYVGLWSGSSGERIVTETPVLQQLWLGKASAGAQTILMKEWRNVPTESTTRFEDE